MTKPLPLRKLFSAHRPLLFSIFLFCSSLPCSLPAGAQAHSPGEAAVPPSRESAGVQEAVFLHTDKSFYLTGETLWFKAYVVDAATRQPSLLSRVVYVELLDGQERPALQAMVSVDSGDGSGSFLLPPSLSSGMYLIRAYTAWMKNFDAAYFFTAPLQVVNTTRRPDWASLAPPVKATVDLFPEGGRLVEGVASTVGFRLRDAAGRGVAGEGWVVENRGDTVVRFRPLGLGVGRFSLTPQKGAGYRAVVRLAGGDTVSAVLPPVGPPGWVLAVTETDKDRLQVRATNREAVLGTPLRLQASNRGALRLDLPKPVADGRATWTVEKTAVGEGVSRLVVVDASGQEVAGRLWFQEPRRRLSIGLTTDAKVYPRRSKVRLFVRTQGEDGVGLAAHLSVSVFLLDSLQAQVPLPAMDDYLFLGSALMEPVDSGAFSFRLTGATAVTNALLLTEEKGPASVAQPPVRYLPDFEGPVIRGRVVGRAGGEPVPGVLCYLSAPGERFYAGNAVSDARGELRFVGRGLYGPAEVVAQTHAADSGLRIELASPYWEKRTGRRLPPFVLPERWKDQLERRHLDVQVANRFAAPAGFALPVSGDTTLFYGQPDSRYRLDEYTRFPTLEEVMREVTAEVRVQKTGDSFRFRVVNLPYRRLFDEGPLMLLDGVPVFETSRLMQLDPLQVRQVDVVARTFFWGNTVNSGLVSYLTYEGNLANYHPGGGVDLLAYLGLQVPRTFVAPVYPAEAGAASREPDRRSVLLWEPALRTGPGGEAEVPFFTSDVPGRYAVLVQGLTPDGRVGKGWTVIDVN